MRKPFSPRPVLTAGAAVLALGMIFVACQGASSPTEPPESAATLDAGTAEAATSASQPGLATAAAKGGSPKVEVCHIPPGNPDNRRVIAVGEQAVTAHLGHGDNLFGDEVCDDGIDNDCDGHADAADAGDCSVCPTTLEALAFWYETTPDLTGFTSIRMNATFRNTDDFSRDFNMNGFQTWTVPSVDTPGTVVHDEPVFVAFGDTGSYDVTFDLSLHPAETGIAFRPVSIEAGTMPPHRFSLVTASFDCM